MAISQGPISAGPVSANTGGPALVEVSFATGLGLTATYPPPLTVILSQDVDLRATYTPLHIWPYTDAAAISASINMDVIEYVLEQLAMSTSLTTEVRAQMELLQQASISSQLTIPYMVKLASALDLAAAGTIEGFKTLAFASQLAGLTTKSDNAELQVQLAVAMTIHALQVFGADIELTDAADIASAFETRRQTAIEALTAIDAASSSVNNATLQMLVTSEAGLATGYTNNAELNMVLEALAGSFTTFQIGNDVYEGWVLNTSLQAFTKYSNYKFSSIVRFNNQYYGIDSTGLYLLEGDDDAGTQIDASFKTGLLALDSRQLKDARALYIGYTSSGELVLKVTTTDGGEKREDWYRFKHTGDAASEMRSTRAQIGRGLRSVYWQFEICNEDGADFEIDDVTLVYNVLTRKIRR